jgi:hypothetical protein
MLVITWGCTACVNGTFKATTGNSACTGSVATGQRGEDANGDYIAAGATQANACAAGTFNADNLGDCDPCANGTFKAAAGTGACTGSVATGQRGEDANGDYIAAGATQANACAAGTFNADNLGDCVPVDAGYCAANTAGTACLANAATGATKQMICGAGT